MPPSEKMDGFSQVCVYPGIHYYINKPSLYGAPFGHGEEQLLIPLNARIEISDDEPYLGLKEDIVN